MHFSMLSCVSGRKLKVLISEEFIDKANGRKRLAIIKFIKIGGFAYLGPMSKNNLALFKIQHTVLSI